MNNRKYKQMVDDLTPKENRLSNMLRAFIVGGLIGIIGTILYINFNKMYNETLSISSMLLVIIATTALITGLGFSDNLFNKAQCGLIIPISGFAHSITSSIMDYKKEGYLNMGSNAFKLAGSVLVYGTVSAIFFTLLKVLINV